MLHREIKAVAPVGWSGLLAAALLCAAIVAHAAGIDATYPQARGFFPDADRFGELEGQPPAAAAYRGRQLLGYVFLTADVVQIPAYSGHPINTLVGFDTAGRITGLSIVGHQEPILLVGISDDQLRRFTDQYRGKSVHDQVVVGGLGAGNVHIDTISGATITVMVQNATVMRAAREVARSRGIPATAPRQAQAVTRPAAAKTTPTATARAASAPPAPIWRAVWQARVFRIAVLVAGLTVLTLILVFQDWLARHPKLLLWTRDLFLLYTLLFIGWYGLAQLSVVNVLTFVHAIMGGFSWESFLIDPLMFLLWSYVAVTVLLWGRGVYCGWLCPFGALQELTFQAARWLRLPHWDLPQMLHERLWALKYTLLLLLFGVSLQSLAEAERLAEIEPFKTAITMRFMREWGFVLFAGVLLLAAAFNRKFYCKYLCVLGAALTFPSRFRIFDWLRRHRECGRPCQVCAVECEVQAIKKNGEINANECHYCLDCQVTYWNDRKCPPLVERRKRRTQAVRAREVVRDMESVSGPSGLDGIGVKVVDSAPERGGKR